MTATGRDRAIPSMLYAPATGTIAAMRSARSAARRYTIIAPLECPVAYTRFASIEVRRAMSSTTAIANPTSSTLLFIA
jgi:hypothetical protein